jgi:hypothetical protein
MGEGEGNIPRLTNTLHQSYNDGMVIPKVVCHPSMAYVYMTGCVKGHVYFPTFVFANES